MSEGQKVKRDDKDFCISFHFQIKANSWKRKVCFHFFFYLIYSECMCVCACVRGCMHVCVCVHTRAKVSTFTRIKPTAV